MHNVRLARSLGTSQFMWPVGLTSVEEIPADIATAAAHANLIISWFDNLKREEIPPRWMWPFGDELEPWFDEVEAERKRGIEGDSSSDMEDNEYARDR